MKTSGHGFATSVTLSMACLRHFTLLLFSLSTNISSRWDEVIQWNIEYRTFIRLWWKEL